MFNYNTFLHQKNNANYQAVTNIFRAFYMIFLLKKMMYGNLINKITSKVYKIKDFYSYLRQTNYNYIT